MKNKKGEIATLLTLGLVLVGTLITLGTSLFVNSKKNIASNSMAASPKVGCIDYGSSSGCSSDCKYDKPTYSCLGDSITGIKKWCCSPGAIPTPIPIATLKPLPACSFTLLQAATKCTEYTSDGCGKSVGKQTYKCVTGTTVPTTKPSDGCGSGGAYPCDSNLGYNNACKDKKNLEFGCYVKSTGAWYGCIGTPCSKVTGYKLITEAEKNSLEETPGYVPQCTAGAYVAEKDCENTCGQGNCQSCKLGSYTTKYECKASVIGNLPSCVSETFASKTNCQSKYGNDAKCTQCLVGIMVRYELGGPGPTQGAFPAKVPVKTCKYNNKTYNQGDSFCGAGAAQNKDWMRCDNGVVKKIVTCASGCQEKNNVASCIPYNSTPTPGTGTPSTTTPIPTSQCKSGPITCKSGNNKNKTYYFSKSTSENCQENMSNNKCYSVNNGGLYSTNCEVLNWLQLENEVCQINNVIDPSPVTNNIICNFINCPNFSQLGYYYRAYTDKYFIDKKSCTNASNVGNTQEYVKNNVCGNSSVQVIQESITGTMLYSPEGNCNLLPNGLCAVNNLNSSSNN